MIVERLVAGRHDEDLPADLMPAMPLRQDVAVPAMLRDARGKALLVVYMPVDRNGDERAEAVDDLARWVMRRLNDASRPAAPLELGLHEYAAVQLMAATIAAGGDAWGDDRAAGRAVSAADALLRALAR